MRYEPAIVASAMLFGGSAQAVVPTAAEVGNALRELCPALRAPIRQVRCHDFAEDGEPTEAACNYWIAGKKPRKDKTTFAVDSKGWHPIDLPAYCPGQKQGMK